MLNASDLGPYLLDWKFPDNSTLRHDDKMAAIPPFQRNKTDNVYNFLICLTKILATSETLHCAGQLLRLMCFA